MFCTCKTVSRGRALVLRRQKQTCDHKMTQRILKDIHGVDRTYPLNKGNFVISVDNYGDMCIKGLSLTVCFGKIGQKVFLMKRYS